MKGINYNKEIPFEKQPQPGFYDISNEPLPREKTFQAMRTDQMEGKRRMEEEMEKRKQDAAKQRKRKEDDLPAAILQFNEMDTAALGKRTKLNLPAPQVTEAELEEVAKSGIAAALPGATPLRALAATGMTPRSSSIGATPMSVARGAVGLTPGSTPIRDEFGINALEQAAVERGRQNAIRSQLRAGLSALPKPSGEYAVVLGDAGEEEDEEVVAETMEADQLDLDRAQESLRSAKLLLRSRAVQRDLPRPARVPSSLVAVEVPHTLTAAAQLIDQEMLSLMKHDLLAYPLDGSAASQSKPPAYIEDYSADELAHARFLLEEEADAVRSDRGLDQTTPEEIVAAIARMQAASVWVPELGSVVRREHATAEQLLSAHKYQLAALKEAIGREVKKAAKAETKAQVLLGGYIVRNGALDTKIADLMKELQRRRHELLPLQKLRAQELVAAPERLKVQSVLVLVARVG